MSDGAPPFGDAIAQLYSQAKLNVGGTAPPPTA
jgi:hypothetical protein